MASATVSSPEPAAPVSSIGRIFGVFFSPKTTFESIAKRPTWLAPLILLCLVQLALTAAFTQRVGWRGFMQKKLENNSRVQQMTPEQQENLLDRQAKIAPVFGYAVAIVGPFAGAVIVAAVYLAVFNLLAGANIKFTTSLGIVAYSWMPAVVAILLGILIVFLKDPSTVDLQHLIASNAGAFVSDDSPKWLGVLLGSLDIFVIWTLLLLAAGYSATNPKKISYGKALAWVVAVWLIFVLLKTSSAAAFS
jgi:Yip1 domain